MFLRLSSGDAGRQRANRNQDVLQEAQLRTSFPTPNSPRRRVPVTAIIEPNPKSSQFTLRAMLLAGRDCRSRRSGVVMSRANAVLRAGGDGVRHTHVLGCLCPFENMAIFQWNGRFSVFP
jgi:hypothetical protein